MSRHWMPLYIGDYLADTRRLSLAEHGAYMLLIMEYWRNGSLPNDDVKISRILGISHKEWLTMRDNISEFFHDGWQHKRIDEELQKHTVISERRSIAASKRWTSKPDANAMQMHSKSMSDAYAKRMRSQPQPQLDTNVSNNKREPSSLEILCEVLSETTASDLLTHRQAKKSKLTPRAAKELVKAFKAYGDPEAAAAEMMLRGWIGFKPDWMENNQRAGPIQNYDPNRRGGLARLYREICERENEIEAKVSDGNVLRLPSVHGVG